MGVERGMAEAKLEEFFKGSLSDPTDAKETGNAKAKTQMPSFKIRILNCLADAMETKEDKTNAKIKANTEVRPEAKARGDTME
uniref:Uncharacterized protein n=1 Tax=Romanomermis culicivorax TaxID=13658 RepID=A0A915JYG5_ROMCU